MRLKIVRSLALCVPVVLLSIMMAACGAPAGNQAASNAPAQTQKGIGDAAKGKAKFQGTCAACHGMDARGMPGLGKDLTTSTFAKGMSDADLVAFISKGRPVNDPANTTHVEMPPRGGNLSLTDQDLIDIVAYIRTLEK